MGCPKVTVTRPGRGPSYAEAVRDGIERAKRFAAQICVQSSADCTLIDLLEVTEGRVTSNPWEVEVAVTFQCRSPKGCLFPFTLGQRGESILKMDLDVTDELGISDTKDNSRTLETKE